ncbi:nicotinate-nucleotide--dimethylbenzimidazole phosphoribosyltransferase [Alcanivorax sp. JB21]|uniref:nicotinate-nucleotide--dimethylbenzimidazole phosphoribosyltransferase n=1 Tax=Alcanivorax limicola TaxID=2874102 RepID=UPI001CBAEDB3|nr:nicotinate-nucleotide--dimethylbenzimidazole phosphoribosyltransferase [Alcanivorax limicola]MBZ2190378.1 nicotinate-nucleotide--dimethylbenzimidazole phosphoribosyltransferase [Alcanivorax limicola]
MTTASFSQRFLQAPPAPTSAAAERARDRQASLTKPAGSLGRLEQLAITLAAQQDRDRPAVDRVHIALFAGDHGVCEDGISAFPQTVTGQMIANFAAGGAAISVLARQLGATLEIIDTGTVSARHPQAIDARIAAGTANLARTDAMTAAERDQALMAGDAAAERAAAAGAELFIGGEMGIGNTTSAAALACALLDAPARALTGPGTGLDAAGVTHKTRIVEQALHRHAATHARLAQDPLTAMASLGGFEIVALSGAMLGCAARRIPVLVDGFIVSVAALAAVRHAPALRDWLHFAHRSGEPGHAHVLAALDAEPLLDLGMRLGEGSGAAVAVPLLRAACALHNEMASFEQAGVDKTRET